mmetsp:Transcript_30117/g.62938  ORF Transcript_30117/g.62938 Transcript_30117/m.62938 type:complete len:256 (-) Transcript_30117:542-1309(-)
MFFFFLVPSKTRSRSRVLRGILGMPPKTEENSVVPAGPSCEGMALLLLLLWLLISVAKDAIEMEESELSSSSMSLSLERRKNSSVSASDCDPYTQPSGSVSTPTHPLSVGAVTKATAVSMADDVERKPEGSPRILRRVVVFVFLVFFLWSLLFLPWDWSVGVRFVLAPKVPVPPVVDHLESLWRFWCWCSFVGETTGKPLLLVSLIVPFLLRCRCFRLSLHCFTLASLMVFRLPRPRTLVETIGRQLVVLLPAVV